MGLVYHNGRFIPEQHIEKATAQDTVLQLLRSFLDAILTGGTAPVPTSQILINQAIIDGIAKSAEVGHEIRVEIPEI